MPEPELGADAFYDAGDEGCSGPTLKEIGALLDGLAPGQALEVRTRDPVGRTNLEAWARLKGHTVASAAEGHEADRWLIRRGE
ncbi:MAG: sulfurtransferase TusA family protein [Actinomycetota bacterium]